MVSSRGDALELVDLLAKLREDGNVPVLVTVGACSVQLAPVYGGASNVTAPRVQSVVDEYGGAAIAKLQSELDGDDEDVPAVRS